jgi:hypothetical protein
MTTQRKLLPVAIILLSALLTFLGVGGFLVDVMIVGNPNPPTPEVYGVHALLYEICAVIGVIGFIFGIVRGVLDLRTAFRTKHS